MIKQTNTENVGIEDLKQPGYAHDDGLVAPEHWAYEALKNDFDFLARDLVATFKFKNVLDIGSGARQLASGLDLIDPSIEVISLDGNKDIRKLNIPNLDKHFTVRTDKEYTLVNEKDEVIKFDLICSFEHFEHIQESTFDTFIENIKKHSHKDTILVATAASWSYSDNHPTHSHAHCNVKTKEQWEEYLTSKDMKKLEISILNQQNWSCRFGTTVELIYKVFNE